MELPPAWLRPDPLRGLAKVPWSGLDRGVGVDGWLRTAAEGDDAACTALADRLLDDDTVSEASAAAVPFLAGLGAGYQVPGAVRDRVIFLLAALASAGAGFTDAGRRTRRRWNPLGRELPRRPPDWITQTRYAVAKAAPRVFESLARAEVACALALAIAVPEVAPAHVADTAEGLAAGRGFLADAAAVVLHLTQDVTTDARFVRALAARHPTITVPDAPHRPDRVTLQLVGHRVAHLAAYG
ncbi:hypothetical protein GCM10022243_64670 [Saccharothrix violaceirubra]|uniref:Uncharacterized protein n=1 Tax=Saccharothrix violaceirubra TaxID=413306 RepID=A0A7W7WZ89_9PSEU|nr:hypothetical protein [Saccharothrix violaceirubra]MBB4969047.1 hypothetical protein [Saccharothrix violaceirubra]